MSSFMDRLKANANTTKTEKEHPIIEALQQIGDAKRVNPPPVEKVELKEEPENKLSVCPVCKKSFKHLARHKCKAGESEESTAKRVITKKANPFVLCIDGIADKVQMTSIIDLIKPVTDAIEKEYEVEHWTLLEFGKAYGTLVRRLEAFLAVEKPAGVFYLDSATKEGMACKEVLRTYADICFIGLR